MKSKEKICGNCRLFNYKNSTCGVAILYEGQQLHMPVDKKDKCHMEELGIEVQQVRWWVEDPKTGSPTNENGVVKIEYPEGFFGKKSN